MLISATGPKKGMGQTVTSINLSAAISQSLKKKVVLVDVNRYCSDVGNYLSDTDVERGMDDFASMYASGLLDKHSFGSCIKSVCGMDIMSSNGCLDIDTTIVKALTEYTRELYDAAVVDTISGNNPITKTFLENSDIIVVILNPLRNVVKMAAENESYKKYKDKLIFIVNRYMDRHEGKRITYGIENIKSDLEGAGFKNKVFCLDYDVDVINECNDGAVLNYILNNPMQKRKYCDQLSAIVRFVFDVDKAVAADGDKKRRRKILNFRNAKGAVPFVS